MSDGKKEEIEKLYGAVMSNDETVYRLCDFEKLCGAVLLKDEELAKEWYTGEYSHSCFAVSVTDSLRRQKNGFIVILGYMRATVMSRNKSSAVIMLENMYMRLVENCSDGDDVYHLFVTAFRDFCNRFGEKTDSGADRYDELSNCTDYIASNLKSAITLPDVAEHCGYNPSYLSRKFKQVYGVSIKTFIQDERLKAAAAILRFSDKSIAEISSLFKFASQSHFQQKFKKKYKITPLQYRKNYKHE